MKTTRVVLAAFALTLGCARSTMNVTPAPIVGYGYGAPEAYYAWLAEVQTCVAEIAALDSAQAEQDGTPRTFTIERVIDMGALQFFAIPSERVDGTFACMNGLQCWALTVHGSVIYISAQRVGDRATVKHEMMHVFVASEGEANIAHGAPWGLCEYN